MNKAFILNNKLAKISLILGSLIVGSCFMVAPVNAHAPTNFSEAKREARKIFKDERKTFYCGCKFDKHSKVNLRSCGYQIHKNRRRAKRLEWEHIVPVSLWGRNFSCWKNVQCCIKNRCYKGRECCRQTDPSFAKIEADLHNIVPEIGELNALRSNYAFAELPHVAQGQFGECNFKIDFRNAKAEPRLEIRGIIARAYLYMSKKYHFALSKQQKNLYTTWDRQFKPTLFEIVWDKKVAEVQGNHNTYILHYQARHHHE